MEAAAPVKFEEFEEMTTTTFAIIASNTYCNVSNKFGPEFFEQNLFTACPCLKLNPSLPS
jgi:hypothetical protein